MFPIPLARSNQDEVDAALDFNVDQAPTGTAQAVLDVPECIRIVSHILTCRADICQAQSELPQLESTQGQVQTKIRQAMEKNRGERQTLEAERTCLESKVNLRRDKLNERVQKLSDQLLKYQNDIQSGRSRQQRLQSEIQKIKASLQSLRSELGNQNRSWHSLSEKLSEKQAEAQKLKDLHIKNTRQLSRLHLEKDLADSFSGYLENVRKACTGNTPWLSARCSTDSEIDGLLERLMPQLSDLLLAGSGTATLQAIDKGGPQAREVIRQFLLQHPNNCLIRVACFVSAFGLALGLLTIYDRYCTVLPEYRALRHLSDLKNDLQGTYKKLNTWSDSGTVRVYIGSHEFDAEFENGRLKFKEEFFAAWNGLLIQRGMLATNEWRLFSRDGGLTGEGQMCVAACVTSLVLCVFALKFGLQEVFGSQPDERVLKQTSKAWENHRTRVRNALAGSDIKLPKPSDYLAGTLRSLTRKTQWTASGFAGVLHGLDHKAGELRAEIDRIDLLEKKNDADLGLINVHLNELSDQKTQQRLSEKMSMKVDTLNQMEANWEQEANRLAVLNEKRHAVEQEISNNDPQLHALHHSLAATQVQISACDERMALLKFNANMTLDGHVKEIEQVKEQIDTANLQVTELKNMHMNAIEARIAQIIEPTAFEQALRRHTLLSDSALKTRVASGRFVNAVNEAVNSRAAVASSFDGYTELQYALLHCHAHATTLAPAQGFDIRLKLDRPLGRVTKGNAVVKADAVVYSYRTQTDPQTGRDCRVITHIVCESDAGQGNKT